MPMVDLVIADNSTYPEKGKMSIVDGQLIKPQVQSVFVLFFQMQTGALKLEIQVGFVCHNYLPTHLLFHKNQL
ncbi:hypothetical protein [Chryseobacterium indoltheticum]|uniref:hypothetical protein n=1 Tax=Chryseobacterium indoltheticum TaxID=254 RepID=UPI003F497DDE